MWTGAVTRGLPSGLAGSGRRAPPICQNTIPMSTPPPPASAGNEPRRTDAGADNSIYFLYFFIGAVLLGVVAVAVAFARM